MDTRFGLVHGLWSIAADGGALLERAAGEAGLDHVTVPVVTGPASHFCALTNPEAPHFTTPGGWHFPPENKSYTGLGVKPPKARWFGNADMLARARDLADRLGLDLVARIEIRGSAPLIDAEPQLCQRNAWGQEVTSAGLCVINPEVQALVEALLKDLRRYEVTAVELADWAVDDAMDQLSERPLCWNILLGALRDICFCPACRQSASRAEIDVEQASACVRDVLIQRSAADPKLSHAEAELLDQYKTARAADCHRWLTDIAKANPARQHLLSRCYRRGPLGGPDMPWTMVLGYPPLGLDEDEAEVFTEICEVHCHTRGWLNLHCSQSAFEEAATLVRLVSTAVGWGAGRIEFAGLEEGPEEMITWLKQAVRKARRG